MTATARIVEGIRITIGLALLVPCVLVAILCAMKLYVTAAPMIAASWNHYQAVHETPADVSKDKAFRERFYASICRDYFNEGYVIRKITLRERAWCELPEYKDRL